MKLYNVFYLSEDGEVRQYCGLNMSIGEARRQLKNFCALYLNPDGSGKPYPNGKGFYKFSNPTILRVR